MPIAEASTESATLGVGRDAQPTKTATGAEPSERGS